MLGNILCVCVYACECTLKHGLMCVCLYMCGHVCMLTCAYLTAFVCVCMCVLNLLIDESLCVGIVDLS